MPVFRLTEEIIFPPSHLADETGLLAVGGDLSPARLIEAYRNGIFPWYSEGEPLLWWFTSPRLVLFPGEFRIPRRLQRYVRKSEIRITFDTRFSEVIENCATVRTEHGGETWITNEMQDAYRELHHIGYAHSVEAWENDKLVGGLYGVALDRVFFGESMFSRISSGSQFALIGLLHYLQAHNYQIIDCQMTTNHLLRFGAKEITGGMFRSYLKKYIHNLEPHGNWKR